MKLLLDIPDNKAALFMDVIKNISYVKMKPLSDEKAFLMEEMREAIENLKLVRKGKLKARPAKELLNEL